MGNRHEVIPACDLHIAWGRMGHEIICVRVDRVDDSVEPTYSEGYRLSLNGGPWAFPDADWLCCFGEAEEGRQYTVSCEHRPKDAWKPACAPIVFCFFAPRSESAVSRLANRCEEPPLGGGFHPVIQTVTPVALVGKRVK